jgi:hypothetical protein
VTESPRHNQRFPAGRWADVTVVLRDGTRLESGEVNARGGPEAPLTHAEIAEKFTSFASPVVGAGRAAAIQRATLGLTTPGSRFSDLVALLVEPA